MYNKIKLKSVHIDTLKIICICMQNLLKKRAKNRIFLIWINNTYVYKQLQFVKIRKKASRQYLKTTPQAARPI